MRGSLTVPFVLLLTLMVVGFAPPLAGQDQINLQDGIVNFHFNGAGTTHVSMLIPAPLCSGGTCVWANGAGSGTGKFQGSGTYTASSPALSCDASGCNGPFYLVVNPDGSSNVVQTEPITFTYNSPQGTLTGMMNFSTVSATDNHLQSIMLGTLNVTGGSFAQYFPNGGNVNMVLGLTFPLQILWKVHGFAASEFNSGTITPNTPNTTFTQTNEPSCVPCSASTPCGTMSVALGSGGFSGDLVVTVQLSGVGYGTQFDRLGFNSDINSGLSLACFNFDSTCTSGVGKATLGGGKTEDGFGKFQNTLYTGLNGGSGCSPDGTGCKNLFTFVLAGSNGPLQLSDINSFVAGHVANGVCSGFIATTK